MWKGCKSGTVPVSLSGKIIVFVDPSVSAFEGMMQMFEIIATGMKICAHGILTGNTVVLFGHS